MTDQQIDEFLELLAKSPTSARDMVRGLFAAHEANAEPAVPKALTKWANSPELVETGNQWQQGYEHARAWVHVQLSCPSSHTSQRAVPQGEPVAVIGSGWTFLWASGDAIEDIVKRHGLKIGSKLYATPAAPSQPAAPQGEPVAFAWRAKKGQPSAWQVCFDLKQADDAEVLAKTEIRFMSWTTPAAPSQEPVTPTDEDVDAAAKVLAERFDYPLVHMPEQGRKNMRETVRAIIAVLRGKEQAK